MVNKDKLFS